MKKHTLYKPKQRAIPLNSRLWQKIRQAVIARDSGLCQICVKRGLTVPGTDVDHVNNDGDDNELTNLVLLCHECHSLKTAQDMGKQVNWGCDLQGRPLDPNHHWNKEKHTAWYDLPEWKDNKYAQANKRLAELRAGQKNHEKVLDEVPPIQSHFYDRS